VFRRREGRGTDRSNETRVVKNITRNPITLGDIDNLEIPAGESRDLVKFASIQRIGSSVDLKTAVSLGFLKFKNRRSTTIAKNEIYDNIIPAVLADTRNSEFADQATEVVNNVKTVSDNYTIVPDDDIVLVSETCTITLPSAVNLSGYHFRVKSIGSNIIVTIGTTGLETIDGQDSVAITTQYNSLPFVSNGSNWFII